MMGAADDDSSDPLVQPRVIRLLKNRRRVVDFGMRKEFWDELESVTENRRRPEEVSQRTVRSGFDRISTATSRVLRRGMEQANESILKEL